MLYTAFVYEKQLLLSFRPQTRSWKFTSQRRTSRRRRLSSRKLRVSLRYSPGGKIIIVVCAGVSVVPVTGIGK